MSHNVIISSDEYILLRNIAKLARYAGEEDNQEIMETLSGYADEHDREFHNFIPLESPDRVDDGEQRDDQDLIAVAEQTANSLMNTGLNGPRMGMWPVAPSNLMCKAAATIRALLEKEQK